MVSCRNGPNCASMGLAQEAFFGSQATSGGRLDDDHDVSVGDTAGMTARPSKGPDTPILPVERVDHITQGVLVSSDQTGDRRHHGARRRRRRHDNQRPTDPNRLVLTSPDQP